MVIGEHVERDRGGVLIDREDVIGREEVGFQQIEVGVNSAT